MSTPTTKTIGFEQVLHTIQPGFVYAGTVWRCDGDSQRHKVSSRAVVTPLP
jgi:hypothetical protein